MRVSYSPGYQAPLPENHIFPMGKFKGLHQFLLQDKWIQLENIVEPSEASVSDLMTVHTQAYIQEILSGQMNERKHRRLGLPWSSGLARRSRLAVQGTINASLMALQDGIAGNLAGGTHHAMPDYGEGFCIFNDVAVAIKILQRSLWVRNVLVIDCDVHQGNGTASVFAGDSSVFTFSIHGENNYPFQKPPSTMDIGLADETDDAAYLQKLAEALEVIFDRFEPDLVYYLGGIDPLETDHFGRLSLSLNGLYKRDRLVIEKCYDLKIPITLLLSGGYAPTLQETVKAHALMYQAGLEVWN